MTLEEVEERTGARAIQGGVGQGARGRPEQDQTRGRPPSRRSIKPVVGRLPAAVPTVAFLSGIADGAVVVGLKRRGDRMVKANKSHAQPQSTEHTQYKALPMTPPPPAAMVKIRTY
uniref:Uncharacterized protein n=1 Tax=Plectus sambesii TaxID=2011161 RepID=A0A914UI52_9BILA